MFNSKNEHDLLCNWSSIARFLHLAHLLDAIRVAGNSHILGRVDVMEHGLSLHFCCYIGTHLEWSMLMFLSPCINLD